MSWLKIDDGFEDHPKVEPLSDAAHRLWSRAACWCAKTGSNGFVPRGMLSAIAKNSAPLKRLEKAAQELVNATAGGVFEKGLWEPADDGWLFHDWQEYQPDHAKQTTLTRSEAASVAGKASADARRTKHGTAQPVRSERPPNDSGTFEGTFEGSFDERRSGNVRRTSLERLEPPDPDPDPRSDLSDLETLSKEPDRLEAENKAVLPAAQRDLPKHIERFERSHRQPDGRALALFEGFRVEVSKPGLTYDPKARELFERLVDEGVTSEDVTLVVRGAKLDDWATGKAKLAASALLGSSEQRQRFAALARDPPRPKGRRGPVQPDAAPDDPYAWKPEEFKA